MKSITQHGNMTRREIDELLWKKLPDWMSDEQRANRIHNLIAELRNKRLIKNDGNAKNSNWILDKSDNLD
jgi:ATP-dependent DNA helicase RecG